MNEMFVVAVAVVIYLVGDYNKSVNYFRSYIDFWYTYRPPQNSTKLLH